MPPPVLPQPSSHLPTTSQVIGVKTCALDVLITAHVFRSGHPDVLIGLIVVGYLPLLCCTRGPLLLDLVPPSIQSETLFFSIWFLIPFYLGPSSSQSGSSCHFIWGPLLFNLVPHFNSPGPVLWCPFVAGPAMWKACAEGAPENRLDLHGERKHSSPLCVGGSGAKEGAGARERSRERRMEGG